VRLLVATGLRREARLLAGAGVTVICGAGRSAALEAQLLAAAAGADADGIVSLGLGGALAPDLAVGDWVVARAVLFGDERYPTDPAWTEALIGALDSPVTGAFLGSETMFIAAADKRTAHVRTGALAVDMESHVAARVARRFGLRFAAARVISDGAGRDLPAAVMVGMTVDGRMALGPVLAALARDPAQLGPLIRTGQDAGRAFRALGRGRRLLGPRLGLVDLLERPLDVG
jgi:adenosylhomocysteine nucleosidase